MARIFGTSIGKSSSIIFLLLVIFISLALSKFALFTREGLDETANPIVSSIISDTTTTTETSPAEKSIVTPPPVAATVAPKTTTTPPVIKPPSKPVAVTNTVSPSLLTSSSSNGSALAESIDDIVQNAVKNALTKCNLCNTKI